MTGVYLIHLHTKMHHAQHYIGYAEDIYHRFNQHYKGQGNPMLKAARQQYSITFTLARTWENETRTFERKLKNRKKASQLCPICKGEQTK